MAIENYALFQIDSARHEDTVHWEGEFRTSFSAAVLGHTPPYGRRTALRVAWLRAIAGDGRTGRAVRGRILRSPHLLACVAHEEDGQHLPPTVRGIRTRCRRPRHRRARRAGFREPARSQDAVGAEFRPYFDNAPLYGNGPSLEDFTTQTPLTVGSPQEVIDRTLTFRRVRRRLSAPTLPHRPCRPST